MTIFRHLRWIAVAGAVLMHSPVSLAQSARSLTMLTWSEYLDPEVAAEFERESGVTLRFEYYETDDMRTRMLSDSQGVGYDVVLINGLVVETYAKHGWVAPIDATQVPNLVHMEPRWVRAFPKAHRHGVPYFWGTLGIGYRTDLVPEPITSWRQLFEPADALRGRILMIASNRDLYGMALKALGYSANSNEREHLEAADRLLQAQKPHVRKYGYMELSEASPLVTGEVAAAMMYSGDALMVREHNENIAYIVPREGGNIWVDYLAIVGASKKKSLAHQFVNFLSRPDIAARNALYVNYATPNMAAKPKLPAEYFANRVIYPEQDVLARSEFYSKLAPRVQRRLNAMLARLIR